MANNLNNNYKSVNKTILLLFVIGLSFGTAVLVWLSIPLRIALSPDSITYISTARSLLDGTGLLSISNQGVLIPLSHYPPFYPLLLAFIGLILNQDPLHVAKWLTLLIIVANIILCSILIYKVTQKSFWFVLVGGLLVTSSVAPFLNIHIFAWTESLYIMLSLVGVLALGAFFSNLQYKFLIITALIFGLAFITRYVGVTLVISGCLCLFIYSKKVLISRLIDTILFGTISCLFMVGFLIRNKILYDTTTNRDFIFHPINSGHFVQFASTSTFGLAIVSILLLVVILLSALILTREKRYILNKMASNIFPFPYEIVILCWYLVIYLTFLIFSISFIDAYTPLDDRILSPIHIPLIVILIFIFSRISPIIISIQQIKWIAFFFLLFIFTLQFKNVILWTNNNYKYGVGSFSDAHWANSPISEKVAELPADATIFTNGFDVLYLWTARDSYGLPIKMFPTTLKKNEDYLDDLQAMAANMNDSDGFIIYFDNIYRTYYPTKQELQEKLNLEILYETNDGTIYQLDTD